MNRRSILGLFGLAPIAAPAAVRAALAEPARGAILSRGYVGSLVVGNGEYIIDGSRIAAGSIRAEQIGAGQISASKLSWPQVRDAGIPLPTTSEDRLVGALGFGA